MQLRPRISGFPIRITARQTTVMVNNSSVIRKCVVRGTCERDAENGVGAENAFVGRAVEREEERVNGLLVCDGYVGLDERRRDDGDDVPAVSRMRDAYLIALKTDLPWYSPLTLSLSSSASWIPVDAPGRE